MQKRLINIDWNAQKFKIDYLQYSTNILLPTLEEELQQAPCLNSSTRFYNYIYDTANHTVMSGRRNPNVRHLYIRMKHEALQSITELPYEANLTRVDICNDYDTLEEAQQNVFLEYSGYIHSIKKGIVGHTYYYGQRDSIQFYERVYWKNEIGKWRYEVEIKPNSKKLAACHFKAMNPHAQNTYMLLQYLCDGQGRELKNRYENKSISFHRMQELEFLVKCQYLDTNGIINALTDMTDAEKIVIDNMLKSFDKVKIPYNKLWNTAIEIERKFSYYENDKLAYVDHVYN